MLETPEVHYVRSGDVSLAYQVVGDGPIDVIEVTGMLTHLEMKWEDPLLNRWIADVARYARLILFDPRGIGLSDRLSPGTRPSFDDLVADVRVVLDETGSRDAVVVGVGDGGTIAAAFAAANPSRTRALVLYCITPLVPEAAPSLDLDVLIATVEQGWGTGIMASFFGADDMREHFARVERRACTPRAAAALFAAKADVDLTSVLPGIEVPTFVLHYEDHPVIPAKTARDATRAISGARYVEMREYSAQGAVRERVGLAAAIEEFVTGSASVNDGDRVLAAVLFTDIVRSTERAAELGDRRWRDLLDEHDRRSRRLIEAAKGRVVKTTGDGVLARFDGAARAVRCAQALVAEARRLGVAVRAGVHVGECEQRGEDIGGIAVHVAARVTALAGADEVYATSTVRETLLGTDIGFEARGVETLRGVPGEWAVYVAR